MTLKSDTASIRRTLSQRAEKINLGARQWWMKYAFHFTDVTNAVGILNQDRLWCRQEAVDRGLMQVENADRTVIAKRSEFTDGYARFYFRPRTPTQYHNEGARPPHQRKSHGAHCPVPIFFLFDLEELLVTEGTYFTNCAAHWQEATVRGSARALRKMAWRDIYSTGGMGTRAAELTGLRHAEILIEESVGLEHLKAIVCRSGPERDTLLHLLTPDVRLRWRGKIRLVARLEMFEASWTYVKSVSWVNNELIFGFSPRTADFTIHVRIVDPQTGAEYKDKTMSWSFGPQSNRLRARLPSDASLAEVSVHLDESLVYHAVVDREELLTR